MAGLQSPGVGSGLDINSIVAQLMAIEQRPLLQLDKKEAQAQAEISAYGSLKSALSGLQSSLDALKAAATFEGTAASSSDEAVFTASSDVDAIVSAYDVTVNRLAQRHKLGSSEFDAGTAFGGGGDDELTITAGAKSFTLDLSVPKTLEEIQAAINVSANETGITAGVITGDSGKQTLVLTAEETGYDARVQLAFGGDIDAATFDLKTLNRDGDGVLLAADAELDASLLGDGVAVTRGSNSINDVVEGLTLTLKGEGRAEAGISRDRELAKDAVNGFMDAYNGLRAQVSSLSQGGLSGNSILRNLESQIRGVFNQGVSGLGNFSYMAELGITTGETGDLELDADMLESALDEDLDSLVAFFTDETNGFSLRLDKVLDGFLQTDGLVDRMIDSTNSRIDDIERSRSTLERRLEVTESRLMQQFTALDGLVAQLTVTSDYLTRQLAVLPGLASNKDG